MLQWEREITLRFLAEPTDINFEGKVRGGAVMKWIDQAGYACAVVWSGQYCVTFYGVEIRYYKPVLIDNVVEVSADDSKEARLSKTRRCVIVFVALDDQGASAEIERWRPEMEEDAALEQYAKRLMELRKGIEEGARIHAGLRAERDGVSR
jgi:acyl-CoA hydrolase